MIFGRIILRRQISFLMKTNIDDSDLIDFTDNK